MHRLRRRPIALVVPLLLAGSVHGAGAASTGPEQVAVASFVVTSAEGTWTLTVRALVPVQGSPLTGQRVQLGVQAGQPSSATQATYVSTLTSSQVAVSLDAGRLTTRLAGVPLTVLWTQDQGSVSVAPADVGVWRGATAQVRLGSARCVTHGGLGAQNSPAASVNQVTGTLDDAFRSGALNGARCEEAVYPRVL